jgi:YidC/Oxa1 family membrane protein insertase
VGVLNPIYNAVAWVLVHIHDLLAIPFGSSSGLSWGLSIVLLVCVLRLILLPLAIKQMHSQRKMTALAPQVNALRKKYKNDKQTMNQEVMKLYQENGANPLMGCLPLIPQMIIFFSLFDVLRAIAEGKAAYGLSKATVNSALHAHIFTATIADRILTRPLPPVLSNNPIDAKIIILIAVLISSATTFLSTRQSIRRGIGQGVTDPNNPMASSQKYMMYIAPLFALSGLYWQFGLVLYWVTTNVWTLGQTSILFRNIQPPTTAEADAASATAPATKGAAGPAGTTVSRSAGTGRTAAARGTARNAAAARAATAKGGAAAAKGGTPATGKGAANGAAVTAGKAKPGAGAKPGAAAKPAADAKSGATAKPGAKGTDGQRARAAQQRPAGGAPAKGPAQPQPAKGADGPPNGAERRGLGRLIRGKPEPEPEPEVPAARLVRQQPVRQSRSKRSGKR